MTFHFTRDVPNVPIFTLKLCPEKFLRGMLCTIHKNCPFTFILMLIFSRCIVSFYNYSRFYIAHSFSCYRIIIIFESENSEPRIFKTTK